MRKYITLFLLNFILQMAHPQNSIFLQPDSIKYKISRHIYGHFAEHLGNGIYGGFYIGDSNSRIPNMNGIRKDVIVALKNLHIPVLRWPGGCFADTYHWKDGIGPKDKRPTIVNTWWGGVTENNSFGTHEFLDMCELLNAEPYVAGNIGSGTVQELSEWVQYINFAGKSPMSDLRRKNGRDKPWNVRYWGIGNEAWGCGGNMTADYYANEYRKYVTFLSGWGNSTGIYRIASGANSDDYAWTEVLLKNIPLHLLNGLALHHYSVIDWNKKSSATSFSEDEYFSTMKKALFMETLVSRHAAIMDHYDPLKHISLVVDEWGGWYDVEKGTNPGFLFQQNTMRDAMIAGVTLNIFNNHADRVKMACLAQTINVLQAVILTHEEKIVLTPTYHVMEMYKVHQDAELIHLKISSANYQHGPEQLPAISASASKDSSGHIHISVVNIDALNRQEITIHLDHQGKPVISGRLLSSLKLQDHNTFEEPDKIKPVIFTGFTLNGNLLKLTLPPFSVVMLELK